MYGTCVRHCSWKSDGWVTPKSSRQIKGINKRLYNTTVNTKDDTDRQGWYLRYPSQPERSKTKCLRPQKRDVEHLITVGIETWIVDHPLNTEADDWDDIVLTSGLLTCTVCVTIYKSSAALKATTWQSGIYLGLCWCKTMITSLCYVWQRMKMDKINMPKGQAATSWLPPSVDL